MSHKNPWIAKGIVLALFVLAGAAAVAGLAVAAGPSAGAAPPAPPAAIGGGSDDQAPAAGDQDPAQGTDQIDLTATACRKAPECATDSDCDPICGVGQGHCVHSSCPVRICKCH